MSQKINVSRPKILVVFQTVENVLEKRFHSSKTNSVLFIPHSDYLKISNSNISVCDVSFVSDPRETEM